jgi:hypothetical protein
MEGYFWFKEHLLYFSWIATLVMFLVLKIQHRKRVERASPAVPALPPDDAAPDLRLPDRSPEFQREQEPHS